MEEFDDEPKREKTVMVRLSEDEYRELRTLARKLHTKRATVAYGAVATLLAAFRKTGKVEAPFEILVSPPYQGSLLNESPPKTLK